MKIVFFQGSFDLINYGHIRAIQRAAKAGDYLIIGLNTNELFREYRGRDPVLPYSQKKYILEHIKGVDKVVPAQKVSPLSLLKKYMVNVYVMGKEWEKSHQEEIAYIKKKGGRVIFTPRYNGVISSGEMKKRILNSK